MAMVDEETRPASELAKKVGLKLRHFRQMRRLTLKDVAEGCEPRTTPQTIQRLEMATMRMSLEHLENMCAAIGVAPVDLFDEDRHALDLEGSMKMMRDETEIIRLRTIHFVGHLEKFLGNQVEGDQS